MKNFQFSGLFVTIIFFMLPINTFSYHSYNSRAIRIPNPIKSPSLIPPPDPEEPLGKFKLLQFALPDREGLGVKLGYLIPDPEKPLRKFKPCHLPLKLPEELLSKVVP